MVERDGDKMLAREDAVCEKDVVGEGCDGGGRDVESGGGVGGAEGVVWGEHSRCSPWYELKMVLRHDCEQ